MMKKYLGMAVIFVLMLWLGSVGLPGEADKALKKNEVLLIIDVQIEPVPGGGDDSTENKSRITDVRVTQTPTEFRYAKNSLIRILLRENGADLKKREDLMKFKVELKGEEIKPESLTPLIRRDAPKIHNVVEADADNIYKVRLGRTGQKYTLAITRYDSFENRLSEGASGIIVYQREYPVHFRYYWGLNAGLFFPSEKSGYSYGLHVKDPAIPADQARLTLTESISYQVKVLVFTSLYPFGFEPARKALDEHRIHFNLGTEISKSILERIYIGLGYDLTNMSINFFWSNGQRDALPDEYAPYINQEIPNANIDSVPLRKINQNAWGISISLPFNFAASLIGNLLGL